LASHQILNLSNSTLQKVSNEDREEFAITKQVSSAKSRGKHDAALDKSFTYTRIRRGPKIDMRNTNGYWFSCRIAVIYRNKLIS